MSSLKFLEDFGSINNTELFAGYFFLFLNNNFVLMNIWRTPWNTSKHEVKRTYLLVIKIAHVANVSAVYREANGLHIPGWLCLWKLILKGKAAS